MHASRQNQTERLLPRGELSQLPYHYIKYVLAAVLLAALFIHRPFCRYLCPLGAFYALFNRFSFFQLRLDREKCTGCGACAHVCPMAVEVPREPDSPECIRCGRCAAVCPEGALSCGFARGVPAANTPDAEKQP